MQSYDTPPRRGRRPLPRRGPGRWQAPEPLPLPTATAARESFGLEHLARLAAERGGFNPEDNVTPLDAYRGVGDTIYKMGKNILWDLPTSLGELVLSFGDSLSGKSSMTPDQWIADAGTAMAQGIAADYGGLSNLKEYADENPGYFFLDLLGGLYGGMKYGPRFLAEETGALGGVVPGGLDDTRRAALAKEYSAIQKRLDTPEWIPDADRAKLVARQKFIREELAADRYIKTDIRAAEREAALARGEDPLPKEELYQDPDLPQNDTILVTGDREWQDADAIREVLLDAQSRGITRVAHGAAGGADSLAGKIANELGMEVVATPAEWDKYGLSAGPRRNQLQLDLEGMRIREVAGFHDNLEASSGTFDQLDRADKLGFPYKRYGHVTEKVSPTQGIRTPEPPKPPEPQRAAAVKDYVRFTPEDQSKLPPDTVLVRGGSRGKEGLVGRDYTVATIDPRTGGRTVPVVYVKHQLDQIIAAAKRDRSKHYYITRDILGQLPERVIGKFFQENASRLPDNLHLPQEWDFRYQVGAWPEPQKKQLRLPGQKGYITTEEGYKMRFQTPDRVQEYTSYQMSPAQLRALRESGTLPSGTKAPLEPYTNTVDDAVDLRSRHPDPTDPNEEYLASFPPEEFSEPDLTPEMLRANPHEQVMGGVETPRVLRINRSREGQQLVEKVNPASPSYDPENFAYIGRDNQSLGLEDMGWGNPFTIAETGSAKAAVAAYDKFIRAQLKENPGLWKKLLEDLDGKNLVCYAHAPPCHGQVLLKLIGEIKSVLRRGGQQI